MSPPRNKANQEAHNGPLEKEKLNPVPLFEDLDSSLPKFKSTSELFQSHKKIVPFFVLRSFRLVSTARRKRTLINTVHYSTNLREKKSYTQSDEIVMNLIPQILQGIVNYFKGLESNINIMTYILCSSVLLKNTIWQVNNC